jgi:hypothetical protein
VEPEGEFQVEVLCLLDRKEIMLWNGSITQVKVNWRNFSPKKATWEELFIILSVHSNKH